MTCACTIKGIGSATMAFCLFVCLFVCLFEFDVTIAGEGLLGTYGHFAVKVFTPTATRGIRLLWSSPRTHDTHTCCRALIVELLLPVFTT